MGAVVETDLVWTRPGISLARAVSRAIREAQRGDALRAVRVVAADGATVDGLRRSLPRAGGACGAEIGGTMRLARTVAAPSLGDRRPVPEVGVLAAVQRVLDDPKRRPRAFDDCARHASTHDALVRSFGVLDGLFTLPVEARRAAFARLSAGRLSAGAVCDVVQAVRHDVLELGWLDAAELLAIATAAVSHADASTQPPLVVVVTQHVNPAHLGFLRAVAARSAHVGVVVAVPAGPSGTVEPGDAADAAAHVSALLGRTVEPPDRIDRDDASPEVTVVSCPDHDEEAREALRRVIALLDTGVPADRIAVLAPSAGPHRAALVSMFAAAGVVTRGQITPPLAGTTAGQVLRRLVACVTEGLDRRTVIDLARIAPFGMIVDDAGGFRAVRRDADRWNVAARDVGIVGESDWGRLAPDDGDDAVSPRDLQARTALAGFVGVQRRWRDQVRRAGTWRDAATALESWFASHCGTVDWRVARWPGVASLQLAAAEQVEGVFARLAEIDGVGLPFRSSTLARLVEAFLDTEVITTESRGTGVLLDHLVAAPGVVADHVVVVGANDGLVPGPVADDLVLSRDLGPEPFGVLTGPADRPRRDRRGLLAALDGATSSVTVTWARHDIRRGGAMYRAALIDEVTAARSVHLEHVVSHAVRATDHEVPWVDDDEWFVRHPDRVTAAVQRRRHAISSRRQPLPGAYDGVVGPLGELGDIDPLHVIVDRADRHGGSIEQRRQLGITALEEYVGCSSLFFVKRVLGAWEDAVDPADLRDVDPRDRGSLVHRVFERLVIDWLADHRPGSEPWVTDDVVDALRRRARDVLDEEAAPLLAKRRLGHPEMWAARRAQLLRAIDGGLDDERRDRASPIAAEAAFGERGGAAPVVWGKPPHDVHFGGSIDRVDRMPDGTLRVMDIKSGKADAYKDITADTPLGRDGHRLQLAFYGWAFEQLHGERVGSAAYRFTGRHDTNPDVTLELDEAVHRALDARLLELVEGISQGSFLPGVVGDYDCPVCTPLGLGADEVNRRIAVWSAAFVADPAPDDPAAGTLSMDHP